MIWQMDMNQHFNVYWSRKGKKKTDCCRYKPPATEFHMILHNEYSMECLEGKLQKNQPYWIWFWYSLSRSLWTQSQTDLKCDYMNLIFHFYFQVGYMSMNCMKNLFWLKWNYFHFTSFFINYSIWILYCNWPIHNVMAFKSVSSFRLCASDVFFFFTFGILILYFSSMVLYYTAPFINFDLNMVNIKWNIYFVMPLRLSGMSGCLLTKMCRHIRTELY